jgi:hypothetical protein
MSSKDIPLDAFVRRIAREAEKNFDRHGEIPMVWFFDIPGEGLCVMITPVDPNTRNQLADRMRSLFWEKRVTRYAMVAEAWAATTPGWTGPAVNDPQRVESVVIYAEDAREAISAKGDIIRPEHGKPYLTKLDVYHGASRGRFANLLAPTKGGPAPRMPDELKVKKRMCFGIRSTRLLAREADARDRSRHYLGPASSNDCRKLLALRHDAV